MWWSYSHFFTSLTWSLTTRDRPRTSTCGKALEWKNTSLDFTGQGKRVPHAQVLCCLETQVKRSKSLRHVRSQDCGREQMGYTPGSSMVSRSPHVRRPHSEAILARGRNRLSTMGFLSRQRGRDCDESSAAAFSVSALAPSAAPLVAKGRSEGRALCRAVLVPYPSRRPLAASAQGGLPRPSEGRVPPACCDVGRCWFPIPLADPLEPLRPPACPCVLGLDWGCYTVAAARQGDIAYSEALHAAADCGCNEAASVLFRFPADLAAMGGDGTTARVAVALGPSYQEFDHAPAGLLTKRGRSA